MSRIFAIATLLLMAEHAMSISIDKITVSDEPDEAGYYSVKLEGKGFGNGAKITIFDDFNAQTVGSNIALNKALIGSWSPSSSYPVLPKVVDYQGDKAMQVHNAGGTGTDKIAQVETVFPETANSIFLSYSVVVPEGKYFAGANSDFSFPDASSWKFTWISDGTNGIASQTLFNMCAPTHAGKGSFMLAGNSTNYDWVPIKDIWNWHDKNYFSFGIQPNMTSLKSLPGYIYFHLTGRNGKSYTYTKTNIPVFKEDNSTSFDRVKFPGWFGNGDFSKFDAYYDDIYVAIGENAFARVELSDNASKDKSKFNVTLPFTSWSDTRVTLKLYKSYLGKSDRLFIRAYDSSNKSQSAKLPCAICPKPPIVH